MAQVGLTRIAASHLVSVRPVGVQSFDMDDIKKQSEEKTHEEHDVVGSECDKSKEEDVEPISFFKLFRFALPHDGLIHDPGLLLQPLTSYEGPVKPDTEDRTILSSARLTWSSMN